MGKQAWPAFQCFVQQPVLKVKKKYPPKLTIGRYQKNFREVMQSYWNFLDTENMIS